MPKLKLKNGTVEDYTIVLSTRDYRHLGQLTGLKSISSSGNDNSANTFSFIIYKYELLNPIGNNAIDTKKYIEFKQELWNQIVDFKLIWVKELNEYYQIKVTLTDALSTFKSITATSLCESELSQTRVTAEINTEADILRDDYEVTTFYNITNQKASLLHRVLEKMPHYTIKHVDESLWDIQRMFSLNETYIYDFFINECSEQFNCIFKFDSATRGIYVYDLLTNCVCGERGDFFDICPKCGGTNLKYYGKDTAIYVDKHNLTDSIQLTVDSDSIKNCLKLVAGDDLMTSTVRMLNSSGSDYLIRISEYQMKDMPQELQNKLIEYNNLCESKKELHEELVSKIYELTDEILYLEDGKAPSLEQAKITAQSEADKLTIENLSPLGLSSITSSTSTETVNSALKNYAKVFLKTGYVKVDIDTGKFTYFIDKDTYGNNQGSWTGRFKITNYSDENDVAYSKTITIKVYDDYKEFVNQKVLKTLAEEENKTGSVFDVLAEENLSTFKSYLTEYNKSKLISFRDAIDGALNILTQLDQGTIGSLLYDSLYTSYYEKLKACEEQINLLQLQIDSKQTELDEYIARQNELHKELNFESYLGDYYKIFCAYKREDTYSNANYISDGLNNVELISRAKEFIETAKKELIKASEPQISITSTLYNLLAIKEFKPIVNNFELGNWIRVKVDNVVYRLHLIGYTIDFDNIKKINVVFANTTNHATPMFKAKQLMNATQTMASGFNYVSKQAEKGNKAQNNIQGWINDSLNASLIQISNNEKNDVVFGKYGILCRSYDDTTGMYDPKQLKITFNSLAFTIDNWKSVEQVIGEHSYIAYDRTSNQWITLTGYGMSSNFVQAGIVIGTDIIGGNIISSNYSDGTNGISPKGTYINLDDGTFSFAGGNLRYNGTDLMISSVSLGESLKNVNILAENLQISALNITGSITDSQIQSLSANKIIGTISSSQILNISPLQIDGQIKDSQIENLSSSKITGSITNSQIESITSNKISDTIQSSKIDETLYDKKLNNATITNGSLFIGNKNNTYTEVSLDGELNCSNATIDSLTISDIRTFDGNEEHVGITNEYVIYGEFTNTVLTFVNGLLINIKTTSIEVNE